MNFFKKVFQSSREGSPTGGSGGSVMTKDELRQSNLRLCAEVARVQPKNDKMTELLIRLQREYNMSKSHDPLSRYNVLKDLIKSFLEDWDTNQLSSSSSRAGVGAVGLVERAKLMAQTQEGAQERKEKYRGLSHAELLDEHESLKKNLDRMRDFVERAPKAVETLKHEYESSKQFDAMRRYKILKDLIKEILALVEPI